VCCVDVCVCVCVCVCANLISLVARINPAVITCCMEASLSMDQKATCFSVLQVLKKLVRDLGATARRRYTCVGMMLFTKTPYDQMYQL